MQGLVSVIIPVYNAEKYVEEAVNSALACPEVGEIILIEDKSPDNALAICQIIEAKHEIVRLLTHVNNENKGAGASRNLGIEKAECEFVAFLDADDYYFEYRFKKDLELFKEDTNIDVVYSQSQVSKGNDSSTYGINSVVLKNLPQHTSPFQFYKFVLKNSITLFHTNAVTIRRSALMNFMCFDKSLRLHQDTEFWWRLLRAKRFHVGEYNRPVSTARRHDLNRITARDYNSRLLMYRTLIKNIGCSALSSFERSFYAKRIMINGIRIERKMVKRIVINFYLFLMSPFLKYYLSCQIKQLKRMR